MWNVKAAVVVASTTVNETANASSTVRLFTVKENALKSFVGA